MYDFFLDQYNTLLASFHSFKFQNIQVQALGNTQLAQASVDANGDGDTTDPADINVSAALNVIINQINNFATPTC